LLGFLYGLVALALAVLLGFVCGTVLVLPFLWLGRGRRERFTVWAAVVFFWLVVRLVLLVRVARTGRVALPGRGAALVICNHRSLLDPMLLGAWTRSIALAKKEVLYLPAIGWYAWAAGTVFVDRRSPRARRRARDLVLRLLAAGHRVYLFPEGTRSRDGELRERVSLRLVEDCFAAGVPVLPCAVHGTERVQPPGRLVAWPLRRVRLDIGQPLLPRDHADAASFARACWGEVARRVGQLRLEAGELAPGDPRLEPHCDWRRGGTGARP
jgi:1-acyl-sn-glycerol-3-phosphate acyltransferase